MPLLKNILPWPFKNHKIPAPPEVVLPKKDCSALMEEKMEE
jgi:hypothetical protein